jgi:hypothetical protein
MVHLVQPAAQVRCKSAVGVELYTVNRNNTIACFDAKSTGISMYGGGYLSIAPLDVDDLVLIQESDVLTCDSWVSFCGGFRRGPVLVESIGGVRGGVEHSCPLRA